MCTGGFAACTMEAASFHLQFTVFKAPVYRRRMYMWRSCRKYTQATKEDPERVSLSWSLFGLATVGSPNRGAHTNSIATLLYAQKSFIFELQAAVSISHTVFHSLCINTLPRVRSPTSSNICSGARSASSSEDMYC